ncbi:MAG: PAS domain S-box protein, partial [Cyanobacteria bacterium SZAS TMP-1]|nr:PAS domain S-box protein [Cyanobacteria bacterium SZAS TMP-1]
DAKSRVEDNLARLQAFVANDAYSLQKEQIGRLDVLSKEKLEFTDQVVRMAAQDTSRAAALVETRHGKAIMDLARGEIRRFCYDTELLLRRYSQERAEARGRMAFLVASMIVLGSVILGVLLLGAYQTIHSKTMNEEQLEQLLKERTENLLQSKEALLAVERQFRVFFDSMPQLGWTAQADGHIDVYNRGWFEYTGTTLEQMAGWGWRSVHDPEILPQVEERWQQSLDNGTPFEMEFPLRRADGIFRWFLTRVTPIKDEEGKVLRWVGVNVDIEDQRNAQLVLKRRQEEMELVAEAIPQLVWTARPDGHADYHNSRWLEYTGLSAADCAGEGWALAVHADDLPELMRVWKSALDSKTPFENILRLKDARGDYRWFKNRAVPVFDNDGTMTRWVGTCSDIDDQKRSEQLLESRVRERTAELRESQRRFQGIFDNTFQFTGLLLLDGTLLEANQTALDFGGIRREDVVGQKFWDARWWTISSETQETLQKAINRAAGGEFVRYTVDVLGATGVSTIDFSLKPYFDDGGRVELVIAEGRDISESEKTREELRLLTDELSRSNTDLKQFAYIASHDLQEPLRTVSSFCELLAKKNQGKLAEDSEKYINIIIEGTGRMQQLIKDLLAYSQLEQAGKSIMPVDLNLPLGEAIADLQAIIASTGAQIVCEQLPMVMGDPSQLKIVFQNLIANAIKFRKEEGIAISICAQSVGKNCLVKVKDNGIGLKMEYAERIFDIFTKLHSRSKYPGTGIGLAICKRVVERHGGSIKVESAPDQGATFIFSLPLAET